MDKFAVVLDDELAKTAAEGARPCPQCGTNRVNYSGLTPHCPSCGTHPWEKHAEARKGPRKTSDGRT